MTGRCHFCELRHSVGRYLVPEKHGEDGGGAERSAALKPPMQGMSHRTPATEAAKWPKDQLTAFGVSHLLETSRNHHFWVASVSFCMVRTQRTHPCMILFPLPFSLSPG